MTAKEVEKSIQEVWAQIKETSKEVSQLSKTVNALTGKWGRFVEGLLVPAVKRLFQERGVLIDKVYQRVKVEKNGRDMEVDILAINSQYAVLIEAKSSLSVEDVKDHLERLEQFKTFFPEYRERQVFGAVAGIVIEENADRYAYRQGLFVIGQSGETVKILNDEKFQPKPW